MRISIVIPAYNRGAYLKEAIQSVLQKDYDHCEIIVCDDGSTEDLAAICTSFESTKSCIRHSRTEQSHGAQVARNRGLSLAQGELVMFMDSDDVLSDGGIHRLISAFNEDSALQYVYGKVSRVNESLEPLSRDVPVGAAFTDTSTEIAGYHWHTMGALYRRSYLEEVGPWNVEMTGSQDWEYQARVKLAGGKRVFVDALVGLWRQHGGERVGTARFRPDYVKSVMIGSQSILNIARDLGRCDAALEQRLAKRLIVHALEWGANGHWKDRKSAFFKLQVVYHPTHYSKWH